MCLLITHHISVNNKLILSVFFGCPSVLSYEIIGFSMMMSMAIVLQTFVRVVLCIKRTLKPKRKTDIWQSPYGNPLFSTHKKWPFKYIDKQDTLWIITVKKRSRFPVFCYGVGRQISFEKLQLAPSKQAYDITISRNNVKKSPSLLHLEKFIKVRKFPENYNFIHFIGLNFEHFQRISTSARELLLPSRLCEKKTKKKKNKN